MIAESGNREPGSLTGYDCPECLNRGYFHRVDDQGRKYNEECKCMKIRRSMRNIEKSGLKDMMGRYTFDTWKMPEKWQENAARTACEYVRGGGQWFIMAGTVGAGKTHLCTAICGALLKRGVPVRYVLWRDIATQAKACVNDDEEYARILKPLKRAKVLYIDDLFKCGKGQEPTAADVNLAFEILNARYNDTKLRTIISSELTIDKIIEIDSAVGSRMYERSKGYYIPLEGKKNWRLE